MSTPCKIDCREVGKICNPHTGKCVQPDGAVGRQLAAGTYVKKPKQNLKGQYMKSHGVPCKQKCTGGTICNPTSGRCISRTNPNAKKLMASKNFKLNSNSRFDWESNLYGHLFPHAPMKVHGVYKGKCKFGNRRANGKCPPNPNPKSSVPSKRASNFQSSTSMGSNGTTPYISTPYTSKGKQYWRWSKA